MTRLRTPGKVLQEQVHVDLFVREFSVLDVVLAIQRSGQFHEPLGPLLAETGEPGYCDNFASWNILADTMHGQLKTNTWIMEAVFEGES